MLNELTGRGFRSELAQRVLAVGDDFIGIVVVVAEAAVELGVPCCGVSLVLAGFVQAVQEGSQQLLPLVGRELRSFREECA